MRRERKVSEKTEARKLSWFGRTGHHNNETEHEKALYSSQHTKNSIGIEIMKSNRVTEWWKEWILGHYNNSGMAFSHFPRQTQGIRKTTPMFRDDFGYCKRLLIVRSSLLLKTWPLLKCFLSCASFSFNSHADTPHIPLKSSGRKSVGEVIFPHGPVFITTKVSTAKASVSNISGPRTHCIERIAALSSPIISRSNNSSHFSCVLIALIRRKWPSKSQTECKPYLENK